MKALIKNDQVEKFPYSEAQFRRDNPGVSFSKATLTNVIRAPRPAVTDAQVAVPDSMPVLVDGVWTLGWAVRDKTADEIETEVTAARANMPVLSRLQLSLVLRRAGIITAEEAKAFAPGNALPAVAVGAIANAPWPQDAKDDAEVRALGALTMRRDNPLILLMQNAVNALEPGKLTEEALDALWLEAVEID